LDELFELEFEELLELELDELFELEFEELLELELDELFELEFEELLELELDELFELEFEELLELPQRRLRRSRTSSTAAPSTKPASACIRSIANSCVVTGVSATLAAAGPAIAKAAADTVKSPKVFFTITLRTGASDFSGSIRRTMRYRNLFRF
jgi:hypothetical protein